MLHNAAVGFILQNWAQEVASLYCVALEARAAREERQRQESQTRASSIVALPPDIHLLTKLATFPVFGRTTSCHWRQDILTKHASCSCLSWAMAVSWSQQLGSYVCTVNVSSWKWIWLNFMLISLLRSCLVPTVCGCCLKIIAEKTRQWQPSLIKSNHLHSS